MYINFAEAINGLGPNPGFRIANASRPPSNYLFATLLPERNMNSYHVDSGNMTVRATMAGLVGMDSPYPPGGAVEISTFLEQSAKLAIDVGLDEKTLRAIQEMLMRVQLGGGNAKEALAQEALNFFSKVVVQSLQDSAEWLRGKALVTGGIDWTFNKINLKVDYGVPTANKLANRTGNDGYGGSTSKFWQDWRTAQQLLRYNVRAVIARTETIDMILANAANSMAITGQQTGMFTLQRYETIGGNTVFSSDARDRITLMSYDEEGEILDPTNPGQTINVPFMTNGKLLFVGNNNSSGYRVGQGSTDDPTLELALGYTHLAPTVEGGASGRWGRVFTPEGQPWSLRGQGVQNLLPVIENPNKVVVASTDLV